MHTDSTAARRLRPTTPRNRRLDSLSAAERAQAVRLYRDDKLSTKEIGRRLGCAGCSIWNLLFESGVPMRSKSESARVYSVNESAFDGSLTPDQAYWLGFMMADGWCRVSFTSMEIGIGLATCDRGHVEKFRTFLGSSHPLVATRPGVVAAPHGGTMRSTGSVALKIASKRLGEAVIRYGVVPHKTPIAEARGGVDQFPDFWRGCIDGDGTLAIRFHWGRGQRKRYAYPAVSLVGAKPLMEQFSAFVARQIVGCRPSICKVRPSRHLHRVNLCGSAAARLISLLYGNGGESLDRKQAIADRIMARPESAVPPRERLRRYEYGGKTYSVVELAELTGMNYHTLYCRLETQGLSVEDAVGRPVRGWSPGRPRSVT